MGTANCLYFGDCLEVMRESIASDSVDLIYLDPPFNSKRLYNAFIGWAQWVAFDDTWRWYEAIADPSCYLFETTGILPRPALHRGTTWVRPIASTSEIALR